MEQDQEVKDQGQEEVWADAVVAVEWVVAAVVVQVEVGVVGVKDKGWAEAEHWEVGHLNELMN